MNRELVIKFERARVLIRIFYILLFIQGLYLSYGLSEWSQFEFNPIWPLKPIASLNLRTITLIFLIISISSSLYASIDWRPRFIRILSFISYFFLISLRASTESIDSYDFVAVLIALVFCIIPGTRSRSTKTNYFALQMVFYAQAIFLLTYGQSGFLKIIHGAKQLVDGNQSFLSPNAFAFIIANNYASSHNITDLGRLIVENIQMSYPLTYLVILIEILSIGIIFLPKMHLLWGFVLLGLHILMNLSFGLPFELHFALIALLFFLSPSFVRTSHP